jgi:hypothetical protein
VTTAYLARAAMKKSTNAAHLGADPQSLERKSKGLHKEEIDFRELDVQASRKKVSIRK